MKSDDPYAHEVAARWGAEDEAWRTGKPVTKMDEALERGYVPGDD